MSRRAAKSPPEGEVDEDGAMTGIDRPLQHSDGGDCAGIDAFLPGNVFADGLPGSGLLWQQAHLHFLYHPVAERLCY